MRAALSMLALTLTVPAWAITGSAVGACPGTVDLTVSGATPGGQIAILAGASGGAERVPGGPCSDAVTALSGVTLVRAVRADGAGGFAASPRLGGGVCSRVLQFLDLATCELSEPVDLGALGGGGSDRCEVEGVLLGMNDGEAYDDGWTSTGGHHFAYQVTPAVDLVVEGAQLFTGESTALASLGIWSDAAGEPAIELTSGSWSMEEANQWQGPVFGSPVALSAGETYWLMMFTEEDYQTSRSSSGRLVTYKWSPDLGLWNGPFSNTDMYQLVTCR